MDANAAAAAIRSVLASDKVSLPIELSGMNVHDKLTGEVLDLLGRQELVSLSDRLLHGESKVAHHPIYTLLQLHTHRALVAGDMVDAKEFMERQIQHCPKDASPRAGLSSLAGASGDYDRVIALLESVVDDLFVHEGVYAPQIGILLVAAFEVGRFDLFARVASLVESIELINSSSFIRRSVKLSRLGVNFIVSESDASAEFARLLRDALFINNEYALLERIRLVSEAPIVSGRFDFALAVAAAAASERWNRAYHKAILLAAKWLGEVEVDKVLAFWLSFALPIASFGSFLIMAGRRGDGSHRGRELGDLVSAAYSEFHRNPGLPAAQALWELLYEAGHFKEMRRNTPIDSQLSVKISAVNGLFGAATIDLDRVAIWILMTWREGADRLLRLVAAYIRPHTTVVISVGGDGRPSDLARASALLLVGDVHLFARPFVTWGGQKLLFQNVLEVMSSFRRHAAAGAWMQVVCDRSYPTISLDRLSDEAALGPKHLAHYGHALGSWGWRREWDDEVVEDLPDYYQGALDEAFETGYPSRFVHMATESPLYGLGDARLSAATFNFSNESKRVGFDGRSSAHFYGVSPFAADMRWMSFSRLQEFVDVSTEAGATYSRPQHPASMRWVHKVISQFDLRNGDPFIFVDKHYVNEMFADPKFDELFVAMNMGFGPEMNFFDTVAASKNLSDHFHHHYARLPSEVADDRFLGDVAEKSDVAGKFFIRKISSDSGRELVKFFADRIFEDSSSHEDFFWAIAIEGPSDKAATIPKIDSSILKSITGAAVEVRDLLKRRREFGRFEVDGNISSISGSLLGTWRFESDGLEVTFSNGALGRKRYESMGSDGERLTFVPAELVSPQNGWSAFLDFRLDELQSDPSVTCISVGDVWAALSTPRIWTGAGDPEVAMLCAFSDEAVSDLPVPAVSARCGVYELRQVQGDVVALCLIEGVPALLRLRGAARAADGKTVVLLARAAAVQAEGWAAAPSATLETTLNKDYIAARWRIRTLELDTEVELGKDGGVSSLDGHRLGRWILHQDGLRLFGLKGLRVAHASQARIDEGAWKLSGWAWKSMKDLATFTMERLSG